MGVLQFEFPLDQYTYPTLTTAAHDNPVLINVAMMMQFIFNLQICASFWKYMRSSILLIHCWTKLSVKLQVLTVFWGYFSRVSKVTEGNFIKINLKKKSHVKGYALRGAGLRKQVKGVFVGVGVLVFF